VHSKIVAIEQKARVLKSNASKITYLNSTLNKMTVKNMPTHQIVLAALLSIGIASNACGDATCIADVKTQMSSNEVFMKEMGSPLMFKDGPFSPKTGDVELDSILIALHKMYVAQNAGDFAKAKEQQNKVKALLQKWKEEQDAKLSATKKAIDSN
jgi:hypothetical protein